jgi:hypothetical protein
MAAHRQQWISTGEVVGAALASVAAHVRLKQLEASSLCASAVVVDSFLQHSAFLSVLAGRKLCSMV